MAATSGDQTSEVDRLRAKVVAQAKEIAVMRWELAAMQQQSAVLTGLTRVKYGLIRRFPKAMQNAAVLKRRVTTVLRDATGGGASAPAAAGSASHRTDAAPSSRKCLAIGLDAADIAAADVGAMPVVAVTSGTGHARLAQGAALPKSAFEPGSLVALLAEKPAALRDFDTIVADAGDEKSLCLLRGQLTNGQTLALRNSSAPRSSVAETLGTPASQSAGFERYANFPSSWLDPLKVDGTPNAAVVAAITWPKISVVMVSFNQAIYLEEGIQSVLSQDYPNLEFIVIDGNSNDGSVEILERYRDRMSFLLIERDKGQSDGLNKGFMRATGDILTWVNSDDLLEPGALFRAAHAFMNYGVDLVAGGCRQIGTSRATVIRDHHNRLDFGVPIVLPLGLLLELDTFWLTGSFFYQPEVFFSREIWQRSGGKLRNDLYYVLDYDLWVRMAAAGATIVHIPDFLACSRTHDQQKTTAGMPYMPEVQRLLAQYGQTLVTTAG